MESAMRNYLKYTLLTWALSLSIASAATINVPADHATIQAALSAAQSGDTVLVQPGTYTENLFWPDRNGIKLLSAGDSSNTIIDGSTNSGVIYMNPPTATIDSTTEIQGFKITNGGNIASGGGIFVGSASPVLTRLWVTSNEAGTGGGLYINDSSPTLTELNLTGNAAGNGGGLYINDSSPTLTNMTVTSNTASYSGGLFIEGGSPTLTNMIVTGNTASYAGGGLNIHTSSPTLTNMTVTSNTASYAGGLYIYNSSSTLTNMTVTGNAASYGGGLNISRGSPTLTSITVSRNLGTGLYIKDSSPMLVNITITGNTSGIYVESGTPTIAGSNIAYHGTGLHNADNINFIEGTNNWWGHPSGPYHPQHNPEGLGDSVNAFVDVLPFLTEPDTAAPPIPVQNLVVTNQGDDFIKLSWDASPIGDLAGYRIYLNTDSSGFPYADTVDVDNTTSVTLSSLEPGLTYYVAATCYDTDGNESWYSSEAATSIIDIVPPASPQNLSAQAGDKQVTLTWTANTENDFLRYRIYEGTTANPVTAIDSSESAFDTTRTISELNNGTTYHFRITAVDTAGNESGFSNEVNVTPSDQTAPAAPTSLVAEAGEGQATMIWAKSTESDFLRYRIYGGTTSNPTTAIDSSESILDITRTISGLDNGTNYYFRITAVDTAGNESGFSNEVSATPTALAVEESSGMPTSFALHANYPNPFNPVTTIRYDLPEQSEVALLVYDIIGREMVRLVDRDMTAGYHQVIWNGRDSVGREVPTGLYIARMVTPTYTRSIKLVLLK